MHNSADIDSFGDLLKSYRIAKGYAKQTDLADALGVSRGTISNWESERRLPRFREDILHIGDVLELPLNQINLLLRAANFPLVEPAINDKLDLTQGIVRLPFGYAGRIQNFLDDYLSAPFGGRDQELKTLDSWLFDKNAPPYLLISSEAGRGKSALLAHWMKTVQDRGLAQIAFIPISIRYNTAQASVVFASLASRLGEIYSDPITIDHFSADRWKEICLHFLERTPLTNKPLLVILDGLDEASDWQAGYDLLPFHPISGIRVVVSARFLAGDIDVIGWLQRLGWDKPGRAMSINLPLLTKQGLIDVLTRMGNPLELLSDKDNVLQELFRLTKGDPLLIRLYIDAMLPFGDQLASLKSDDLKGIETGLTGYFEQWWKDQRTSWGDKYPLKEKLVSTILNLFACALAPLQTRDILAIAPKDSGLNTWTLEDGIYPLRRFIIGNGKEHGFVFGHSRLANFFYEKLDSEQDEWETYFLEYGKRTLTALNNNPEYSKNCPLYPLQTYGAHLERSKKQSVELNVLISEGWMRAWYKKTGSYTGFLTDVDRAWKRANAEKQIAVQVKCAICHCSVRGISANIQPELLKLSLQHKLLDGIQALMIVEQTMDDTQKSKQIIEIYPNLVIEQQRVALQSAQFIKDERSRAKALSGIANYLSPELLSSAIQSIQFIKDLGAQAEAYLGYVAFLSNDQITVALQASRSYSYEWDRIEYIRRLVSHKFSYKLPVILRILKNSQDEKLIADIIIAISSFEISSVSEDLLTFAQNIKDRSECIRAFSGLSKFLSQDFLLSILRETNKIQDLWDQVETIKRLVCHIQPESQVFAINVIQEIRYEWARAIALAWLAKYIPNDLLPVIIKTTDNIEDERSRIEVLIGLIPHLPPEKKPLLISYILDTAKYIRDGLACADFVAKLAPFLTQNDLSSTLEVIQEIENETERAQAYVGLIIQLSPELRSAVIDGILQTLPSYQDEKAITRILIEFSPYLSRESFSFCMPIISSMKDELLKSLNLSSLAKHLPNDILQEAFKIAKHITNSRAQSIALTGLSSHLPLKQQRDVLEDALNAAQFIQDDFTRAKTIARFAEFLPSEALLFPLEAINHIHNDDAIALAYTRLAPLLPSNLITVVINNTLKIQDEQARASALAGISKYLPSELLPAILNSISHMEDEHSRAMAFTAFAPHLSPNEFSVIIKSITKFQNVWDQVNCFSNLAAYLQNEQLSSIIIFSSQLQNQWARSRVLIALASHLPVDLFPDVIRASQEIQDEKARAEAFTGIASHVPVELFPDLLQATQEIQDEKICADALSGMASHLPVTMLTKALQIAQNFHDERAQADAIVKLAPYLTEGLLSAALIVARQMKFQQSRARTLAGLATYLPEIQKEAVLAEALKAARAVLDVTIIPHILLELADIPNLANHDSLIKEAFTAASYITDEKVQSQTLVKLAARLPYGLFSDVLLAVEKIKDEWERANAIIGLTPYMPTDIVIASFNDVQKIRYWWARSRALAGLVNRLEEIVRKDADTGYTIWVNFLQNDSCISRDILLSDISPLSPFILAIDKEEERIHTTLDIIQAILDVSIWWP